MVMAEFHHAGGIIILPDYEIESLNLFFVFERSNSLNGECPYS
jgi:hypothetical protein